MDPRRSPETTRAVGVLGGLSLLLAVPPLGFGLYWILQYLDTRGDDPLAGLTGLIGSLYLGAGGVAVLGGLLGAGLRPRHPVVAAVCLLLGLAAGLLGTVIVVAWLLQS